MRNITCIVCPNGCSMKVNRKEDSFEVEGNMCSSGRDFAICEMTNPMRTLCTTVKTSSKGMPRLPVRTSREIPKDFIFPVMRQIDNIIINHTVQRGEVIISNILDTGADIIATSDMYLYEKGYGR